MRAWAGWVPAEAVREVVPRPLPVAGGLPVNSHVPRLVEASPQSLPSCPHGFLPVILVSNFPFLIGTPVTLD